MMDNGPFDVVVVGAGAAGCVLARRLTEDAERTVALLEAGPDYGPDPSAWPADMRDPDEIFPDSHPWGYLHAGRPADRPLALPRARVVGGSSTINGCIWLRGSAADYDGWAALGNPGWGFADLLPYFRRAEADPLGGPFHGTDGPVPVFRVAESGLEPGRPGLRRRRRGAGFPVARRPQRRFGPAPGRRSYPEERGGRRADARGLHLPRAGPAAPEPDPHPRRARRPRLLEDRPGDGRAHRRRAGGARAAGRPLRGSVRLAGDPAPLRHRAGGGPARPRHPRRRRPPGRRRAPARPPPRHLHQRG